MTDNGPILANRATVVALVEEDCAYQGIHTYFKALVDQGTIPIDFPIFLKCLRLAQTHGGFPPFPGEWWLSVAQRYGLWTDIHGREDQCPCMTTNSGREVPS